MCLKVLYRNTWTSVFVNGNNNRAYLVVLWPGLNELGSVERLEQWLAHQKHQIPVGCDNNMITDESAIDNRVFKLICIYIFTIELFLKVRRAFPQRDIHIKTFH